MVDIPLAPEGFSDTVVAGARRLLTDALSWVVGRDVDVGPIEWAVLLVLIAILLARIARSLRDRCDRGAVTVGVLDNATGDDQVQPPALSAYMSDFLAGEGLLPPPAPAGTPEEKLIALIQESEIEHAKWVSRLLTFVVEKLRLNTVHTITGTLREGPSATQCAVTIQLTEAGTTAVERVESFYGNDLYEAVDKAAGFVVADLNRRCPASCAPLYARPKNPDAVVWYRRGLEIERRARGL